MEHEMNGASSAPIGLRIGEFCKALAISRPLFYKLQPPPRSVRLSKLTLVLESPREYVDRIAQVQAQARSGRAAG